jgi:succinyl-CoA synthetase beta subunit
MKIHEYQAKEILKKYGVTVPEGFYLKSETEFDSQKQFFDNEDTWVVKAQIHAGGRGKGGGVKLTNNFLELQSAFKSVLGMQLITPQNSPNGQQVKGVLIEKGVSIDKELYIAFLVDRAEQKICMIFSTEGGTSIEETAEKSPEKIFKVMIDPNNGVENMQFDQITSLIEVEPSEFKNLVDKLYKIFIETDASLVEINPLIKSNDSKLIALDAKMNFDSNALFRQNEIVSLRDFDEEDKYELEASNYDLSYISLDGNIACMVNGAGLAMATMDTIKLFGGEPANFLDVGGGASVEKVKKAFEIMVSNPKVSVILVNIFGGIMKCDVIAEGIVKAAEELNLEIPLIVRMKGTNEDLGKDILDKSALKIQSADDMESAAKMSVNATNLGA